jgi:hypothetical protein
VKRLPAVGDDVTLVYLNAREAAVVEAVDDGGRALLVVTEHAEVLSLRLNATGSFVTADRSARLLWD